MQEPDKIIDARPAQPSPYLKEVWRYRHLILVLAKRELKGHLAQTAFGWIWLVLRPITTLLVFTLFFGQWLKIDTGNVGYPAFAFSGMLIWYLFSDLCQRSSKSTQQATDLTRKVYFPKLIIPLASATSVLLEFSVHLILLCILLLIEGATPKLTWLLAPLFLIPAVLAGLGIGLWTHILTIRFRDLHQIVPQLIGFGIWLTPVFYPGTIIPEAYRSLVYWLNPIASTTEGLRWALFGNPLPFEPLAVGSLILLALLLSGLLVFIRLEKRMTDFL